MRIHLKITAQGITIPFDHQHLLTGCIHKWLGQNKEHGEVSLYSFSWLQGGRATKKGITFENDCFFFIGAHKEQFLKTIINGIQNDNTMFQRLKVSEIILQKNPEFVEKETFHIASPIFIKRNIEERQKHFLFDDVESDKLLKETLLKKMEIAGLSDDTLEIAFDRSFPRKKTQKVTYRNIENRCNYCPVIIKGKPETKLFAWNVGVGNSTGIGFGALK